VRLIADDGTQVGVVTIEEALRLAQEAGLDLVEVAPTAKPPVCKITDYNKLQYEKKRKAKETRKKTKQSQLKEIKLRPTIDPHDFTTKVKKVREFLQHGDKVKLTLMFRGRQIVHANLGEKVLRDMVGAVSDVGQLEGRFQLLGRIMGAILVAKQAPVPAPTPQQVSTPVPQVSAPVPQPPEQG
jgi:translation initiation factor IF-3